MEYLLSLVACLGLWGSIQNKTKVETVTNYNTIVVVPPAELIADCNIADIPDPDKYLAADWTGKESMLMTSLMSAQKEAMLCNVRLASLRKWKDEQLKVYSDQKKAADLTPANTPAK